MSSDIFDSKEFIEAVEDKEFIKELSEKDRNGMKKVFATKGINITDDDLDRMAEKLEEIAIGNTSGGGYVSEFVNNHPWLTFFTAAHLGAALVTLPYKIVKTIKSSKDTKK